MVTWHNHSAWGLGEPRATRIRWRHRHLWPVSRAKGPLPPKVPGDLPPSLHPLQSGIPPPRGPGLEDVTSVGSTRWAVRGPWTRTVPAGQPRRRALSQS